MSKLYDLKDLIPYIVLVGVPDKRWMESVIKHLENAGIKHCAFLDTDFDFGIAAVATVPLEDEQRKVLKHYPLWRE